MHQCILQHTVLHKMNQIQRHGSNLQIFWYRYRSIMTATVIITVITIIMVYEDRLKKNLQNIDTVSQFEMWIRASSNTKSPHSFTLHSCKTWMLWDLRVSVKLPECNCWSAVGTFIQYQRDCSKKSWYWVSALKIFFYLSSPLIREISF